MKSSGHVLRLGQLILSDGGDPNPMGTEYRLSVVGEDFTLGEAAPVERVMESFLQDGAVTQKVRDGNREISFRVIVEAPDSGVMALAEADLNAEIGKPNALGWTPADGWGPESVFDVFTSRMDFKFDDLMELNQGERAYVLTLTCHPHARSAEMVVTPALQGAGEIPPDQVTTTINPASDPSGWSIRNNTGTIVDLGSYLRAKLNAGSTGGSLIAVYTAPSPVTLSPSSRYVQMVIDFRGQDTSGGVVSMTVDGVQASLVGAIPDPAGSGATRYTWQTDRTTGTVFTFQLYFDYQAASMADRGFNFTMLEKTNRPPFSGTSRQSARAIKVKGSTRTAGSLIVSHPTNALGNVLVYTQSADLPYSPAMRQYFVTGSAPVAGGAVSGSEHNVIAAPSVFGFPAGTYRQGSHNFMALLRAEMPGTYICSWVVRAFADEGRTTPAYGVVQRTQVTVAQGYGFVSLATATLPGIDTATPGGVYCEFQFQLSNGPAGAVFMDEGYFLNLDLGDVTALNAGTKRRVWVDGPTVDSPRYRIFRGNAEDRSDAVSPGDIVSLLPGQAPQIVSYGAHRFAPPLTSAFIVTSGALSAAAEFRHYPRWHTHAAEVS